MDHFGRGEGRQARGAKMLPGKLQTRLRQTILVKLWKEAANSGGGLQKQQYVTF